MQNDALHRSIENIMEQGAQRGLNSNETTANGNEISEQIKKLMEEVDRPSGSLNSDFFDDGRV